MGNWAIDGEISIPTSTMAGTRLRVSFFKASICK
jgi:hypothetical protein